MSGNETLSHERVRDFLDPILGADLHAKRIASLADATTGALRAASLAVCAIGAGLAAAKGLNPKHAGKQVDRMLSNPGIDLDAIFPLWVSYIVGGRDAIAVALDWTDFDADGQATLLLSTLSAHGRATPLLWQSVEKRALKNQRSLHERRLLVRLAEILPTEVKVCVIADRGFGDRTLYRLLSEELHFDYVIRFRGNIAVTAASGETRSAAAWVRPGGRARTLPGAAVTAERYRVGSVVCLRDAGMKQAWCLASSYTDKSAAELAAHYGKRWGIEAGLRDTKDLRFGMGMAAIHVSSPERRDRLWLINAFAVALLTLLGATGEALGYDRMLKSNTAKRRTHSLFRQGAMLYDLIPNMPAHRLAPLMAKYDELIGTLPVFRTLFAML
jgi:DDE family transposase